MVLDIPGKLFGQRDVRETPASTATATSVGLTDGKYVVVDFHADMSDERKITEGTGIEFTDNGANGTFVIALKNKTSYWSIPGSGFLPVFPDVDDITYGNIGQVISSADNNSFCAVVCLPNGAVITNIICYGNTAAEAETWQLYRIQLDNVVTNNVMASAAFNTADSSITNATIDNNTYSYQIRTSTLDQNDSIYSAKITYTTDYI